MKLVLAEDRSGELHGEHAFTSDVVLVGRDPAICHYFFSQEQWPMVSRKHTEFHLGGGHCTVMDANSRFGTFVNGEQISAPVELKVGSHVQLGAAGPIIRVVSIEQSPAAEAPRRSDMGRMDTVRDQGVHPQASAPPKPAAPPPSKPAAPPPPIPQAKPAPVQR